MARKWLNVFGTAGSGKTHLSKILEKIQNVKLIDAENVNNKLIQELNNFKCLIIDGFKNNIDEKLLYSIFNQSKQLDNYLVINSSVSIKELNLNLMISNLG